MDCFGQIRTGFPVAAATEQEKPQYRLLFGPDSTEPLSHVVEASAHALLLQGFNLSASDVFDVEMVAGADSASYAAPIVIGGQKLQLSGQRNLVVLPWPMRYQLRKVQGSTPLGGFVVYAVPVPFEYLIGVGAAG